MDTNMQIKRSVKSDSLNYFNFRLAALENSPTSFLSSFEEEKINGLPYIGRQTRDILGEQGEAAFNRCQADIISHCIGKKNVVVLLEECVVSSEQCRKLLSSEFVVYLKVSIPTQLGRMKNGRVPSLPVDDMKNFLEKQHRERDAFYEEVATLVVESVGYSDQASEINKIIEEDVNKVMKALGK